MSIFDAIFKNRLKYVNCKIWETENLKFPELDDPDLQVDGLAAKPNVGIAFSGGGTRSASATLGQLRALGKLDLLKKVRYISSVSGGSWACVPYTYLPADRADDTFLGDFTEPSKITLDDLKQTNKGSYAHTVANSVIVDDFFKNVGRLAGDESWSRAIGDVFLNDFGIHSLKRFFSLDQKSVSEILNHNQDRDMREDDFYTVHPGRPYLIVGSTLLRVNNDDPAKQKIHFETTPLYAGARVLHEGIGSGGRDIGGGYIEPFGFDSDEPEDPAQNGRVKVRLGAKRHRYTLSDVAGTSGSAPSEFLEKYNLNFLGFPEFKHWPVVNPKENTAREYSFGDGGLLENLGIMPLLMRKVAKIILFVNTNDALEFDDQGNVTNINDSIPPLFNKPNSKDKDDDVFFSLNAVFDESKYDDLVNGLRSAKESKQTVMFKDTYAVKANPHYGIEGGWDVEVLWVYNERVKEWEKELPAEVKNRIGNELANFPHYKTVFQNKPKVIDLKPEEVNLLAHLSSWNITYNEATFQEMLS